VPLQKQVFSIFHPPSSLVAMLTAPIWADVFSGIGAVIFQNQAMPTSTRRLPLYVALAAFVLYACTLGGKLTLYGLPLVSKLAGWDETPMVGQPLLWLLTLPLPLLPAAWLPLILNLLAATLAAAILGLLTRTLQMLPWDYPWDNVSQLGRVPPGLTAAVVCGLEFSYWQEATSTCADLLDLLLLVAALWLLLEYNLRRQPGWLSAATVVWGLGMAHNWMMILALPLFVVVVIWLERFSMLTRQFMLRLAGLGAAGFSIYVLPPTAYGLLPHSPWSLGHAWFLTLQQTWHNVALPYQLWHANRFAAVAMAICFLVPTLPLLIRMQDEGTHNKSVLDQFQIWLYRCLRLGVLLACFWLAYAPTPGGRQMIPALAGQLPRLTFDYLNALGAAFLVGNLLLISQLVVRDEYGFPPSKIPWRRFAVPLVLVGLAVVALGLAVRNAPVIWRTKAHPLEQFGEAAVRSLPAGRGVVLSDFPDKLMVFQAALARAHGTADWLTVDTRALPTVRYRARLEQRRPAGWLTDQTRHELTPIETLRLLAQVARTNRLFYLHPSFGHFFETFYLEPTGTIQEMKLRGENRLEVPAIPGVALEANEQFWTRLWSEELAAMVPPSPRPSEFSRKLAGLGLTPAPRYQDLALGQLYSIPLEAWGVTLQRQGRLREAQTRFEQALLLNSNNLSARYSLACNTNLQAGNKLEVGDIGKVGSPDYVIETLKAFGPFDDPTHDFFLGSVFLADGMLFQAAEQLARVQILVPAAAGPARELAGLYNRLRMPERSLALVNQMREELRQAPLTNSMALASLDLDLALEECNSWRLETNQAKARDALLSVVKRHPDDPQTAQRVVSAFLQINDLTDAGPLVDERLASAPEDANLLNAKGVILLKSGQAAAALPYLDHALAITNAPFVRLNRALAQIENLDFVPAKSDLAELQKSGYASEEVNFANGLLIQAADQLERARALVPGLQLPELALPMIYNRLRLPERSRFVISHLREELAKISITNSVALGSLDLDLALEECHSWLLETNQAYARDALLSVVKLHPDDAQIADRVVIAFLDLNDLADAGPLVEERLARAPDDVQTLNSKAIILIKSNHAAEALPYLDHALALTNGPPLRLNRAMAYIANQDFVPAKRDLAELQKNGYAPGNVNFELALVAEHDADMKSVRHYLQLCLSNTPAGAPLWQEAYAHWRKLEPAPK
jgi:Flp pilus assembly protein TadD